MTVHPNRRDLFDAIRPFAPNRRFTEGQVAAIDFIADDFGLPREGRDDPTVAAPGSGLRPSEAAYAIIKEFEGCKLTAYLCPAGVWTIGWGATGPGITRGVTWTQQQADDRLRKDVEEVAAQVRQLLGNAPTTQAQFDALVSFAYNCGTDIDSDHTPEGLGDSSLLRKHLAKDYSGAAREFGKWVNGGGRKLNGLVRRREIERLLYTQ
jgi:lysozyme